MNKTELEKAIEDKKAEIKEKGEEIDNFEINPDDYDESYSESLDSEGPINVAGMQFEASRIIEELDPTAYRCGLVDYVDSMDNEYDPKFQELVGELETLEDELSDLESELEDIEEK